MDSCDPQKGCSSQPLSCDDQDPCTVDSCDIMSGCSNVDPPGACLTGNPDFKNILQSLAVTYYYNNNLTNGIWHGPSDMIIAGHYGANGYWRHPAGNGGYPSLPNNDVNKPYHRMVHMPAVGRIVISLNKYNSSKLTAHQIGTINQNGNLSGFQPLNPSDNFAGMCNLISSSDHDLLCFDGANVRHYDVPSGNGATVTFVKSVQVSVPLSQGCSGNCYGGTFAYDGMYYYFSAGGSSSNSQYMVYGLNGMLIGTYKVPNQNSLNSIYFDWSVGRYAVHAGFGTFGGGAEYTWQGGATTNDSQAYTFVSAAHKL